MDLLIFLHMNKIYKIVTNQATIHIYLKNWFNSKIIIFTLFIQIGLN